MIKTFDAVPLSDSQPTISQMIEIPSGAPTGIYEIGLVSNSSQMSLNILRQVAMIDLLGHGPLIKL